MSSLWQKIWRGEGRCTARFRDETGQAISLTRLLRNGPRALFTGASRKLFDLRPERPWVSYDASALFDRHLDPASSKVLEFGAGMSTRWFAERAKSVHSIEDHPAWFERVQSMTAGSKNVSLRLAETRSEYVSVPADQRFDLILIDGMWRDDCARLAVNHLDDGGVIYLDNCDKRDLGVGDMAAARAMLIQFAKDNRLSWREFTDFAPAQFFVERGLWVGPFAD